MERSERLPEAAPTARQARPGPAAGAAEGSAKAAAPLAAPGLASKRPTPAACDEGVAPNAADDAPARLAAPEPRQHKETAMALAQYRSRRDAERSCPWFHTEEQLEAIAEQAYDETTSSTTERAPAEPIPSSSPLFEEVRDLREGRWHQSLCRLRGVERAEDASSR